MGPGTVLKIWKEGDENRPCCEGYNCECNNLADVTLQGETDSFGFETINLCKNCREKMDSEWKGEKAEFLKENSEVAPDGKVWLSVADVNDGSDWWMTFAKDKAEVLWERRQQAGCRYGSHGGLYRPSLELVDENYANAVYDRWCDRFNEEVYEENSDEYYDDEDWDDDDCDDDYYDDEE